MMNVSELCSDLPTEPSPQAKINHESSLNKTKAEIAQSESIQSIRDQSTNLHDNLKHLKAVHRIINSEEQEDILEELCKLAKTLCEAIDGAKLNSKKRGYLEIDNEEEEIYQNHFKRKQDYELIRNARNNQDSHKYYRRSRNMTGHKCHSCGTTETPEWRRGPDGARTLCNACGLHYSKLLRKGAIGAQTGNFLLKNRQLSIGSTTTNNNENSSLPGNYPFILIDPKYGFNKKTDNELIIPSSKENKQLHPVNKKEFKTTDNHAHSAINKTEETNETHTIPLKIYQWKQ